MIDRMRLALDVLGVPHPAFFLASATLNNATAFAHMLTGSEPESFLAIDDRGAPTIRQLYAANVPDDPEPVEAQSILQSEELLGTDRDAICFVQSKFAGHRIRDNLEKHIPSRTALAYDADMTATDRRQLERAFFTGGRAGRTVIATSALEVGVDLPALDVAVFDEFPPRRSDLLQRIGRVGRRVDQPGLAILCLGYSPLHERLQSEPQQALSIDTARALPLPLGLETIRLKMMSAAFAEWMNRLRRRHVSWDSFNNALGRYFGERPSYGDLKARVQEELSDVVDLDQGSWYYHGFRASASQGRIPLKLRGTREWVAVIEDTAIFRDAHPEGVYLGHRGQRYRIVGYSGQLKIGEWSDEM
jgi:DEAD/DEAH box helicase domain-containing protein